MEYSNDFIFTEFCPYCYSMLISMTIEDFKPDYYGEKTCTCPNCSSKISLKQFLNKNYNNFNYNILPKLPIDDASPTIPGGTTTTDPGSTIVPIT